MILSGDNAKLLDDLYDQYLKDPASVGSNWQAYFRRIDAGEVPDETSASPQQRPSAPLAVLDGSSSNGRLKKQIGLQYLVEAYRSFGHLAARLDPLGMQEPDRSLLLLSEYGLDEGDLNQEFESGIAGLGRAPLSRIIEWLEGCYAGGIGIEYTHILKREEREWLQNEIEKEGGRDPIPLWAHLRLYEKLYQAERFEKFLAQKYPGKKRFSLEGGEALIPMLDMAVEICGEEDIRGMVIGMAHRGRLNVLVNIIEKPAGMIFAEYDENYNPDTKDYADVKYHLGYSSNRTTRAKRDVHLSLAFNPSHLEAVDPVVMGSVRARQNRMGDAERKRYLAVQIHGDAAFVGQGVVAETLNLNKLEGYRVGGSLHIVVNNQIGFTTLPNESRSTRYATDLAKGFLFPIFHVNGDDLDAVYRATRLAMAYRKQFQRDAIIDLVCYRRLGHNETDEPSFTQPRMYAVIKKHPTTVKIYKKRLLEHPEITKEDLSFIEQGIQNGLEDSFQKARAEDLKMKVQDRKGRWSAFIDEPLDSEPQTRLLSKQLERVFHALTDIPDGFSLNPKLKRFLENRKKMFAGEMPIDWGFAEALAFGSILENGFPIRLSGQDAERGTFSHRHAVFTDTQTEEKWIALQHISEKQAEFEVINAPLSEYSVLGFEFGYSLAVPYSLVIWEAQFGDFANSAQIMIDQFITSSEVKWHRLSGLVMLLPHGYEGQGPEHSSARLERFLQQCSKNNIQVCNCTTPAQYFHLLRRQILRRKRKPLIIMSPKSLLRLQEAGSNLDDISLGIFREVLYDRLHDVGGIQKKKEDSPKGSSKKKPAIRRILFCSGKVYYDLHKRRQDRSADDILIVRIEQLYPWPAEQIQATLTHYPKASEYLWVQEEPENQGAWNFVKDRLQPLLPDGHSLGAVCRPSSPSPAAGLHKIHTLELQDILNEAVGPR